MLAPRGIKLDKGWPAILPIKHKALEIVLAQLDRPASGMMREQEEDKPRRANKHIAHTSSERNRDGDRRRQAERTHVSQVR